MDWAAGLEFTGSNTGPKADGSFYGEPTDEKLDLGFLRPVFLLCGQAALFGQSAAEGARNLLWYQAPAPIWDHALPIGNGRLGAMVFGGANHDANNGDQQDADKIASVLDGSKTVASNKHLQLNESSLWHGSRANRLNPCAHEAVPKIRQLLLDSKGLDGAKISAAEKQAQECMIGIPSWMPGYSTLGDLYLHSSNQGAITGYRRQLDLDTGVVKITYAQNGVHYTREIFASVPDEVIVVRLSADRESALNFRVRLDRPADFSVRSRGQDTLVLREGPDHKDQIRFAGEVLLLPTGGSLHTDGSELVVAGADSVTVLITAAIDFKGGPFAGGDPEVQCEQVLAQARKHSAKEILNRQEASYQPMFRRMSLHLDSALDSNDALPTDERAKRAGTGADDLGLQELYFQFARYLLISSSRPTGLPANLQGIWAGGISNPWGSKWTINVNTEMNYWLAEPAGLGETTLPLINLIDMVDDGSGHLVTGPSLSPENSYRLADGTVHGPSMGPTIDIEIVRELFSRTIDAGQLLGEDPAFLMQLKEARGKLPPFAIGKHGQLQEWKRDYDENEPGHRHISHLWALYPGTQISLKHTPELAEAARTSLERRLAAVRKPALCALSRK